MRTICLTSQNLVADGQNNKLVYNFPNSVQFKDNYISLSSVSIYYSWFNISSALANNTFQYTWVTTATTTTQTITIPDGLYEIATLNSYLQTVLVNNGHYLVNSVGQNVYYLEFLVNPSRYAFQLNTFQFPNALPSGFSNPSGVVLPTQTFNPRIIFTANLGGLLGFPTGLSTNANTNNAYSPPASTINYISKNSVGTLSYLSTQSPNLQPNSTVLISCSIVSNPHSTPSTIIYAFSPNVGVGKIIFDKPPTFMFNKIMDGTYNQLQITLLGSSNLQPLVIQDPSITVILVIADKDQL
jgi:hypothetical protein